MDGVSGLAVALYRAALTRRGASAEELAAAVDRPAQDVGKPLAGLADMGLLRIDADGERYSAVSPMLAEATTLGVEDLDLSARRMSVEARRNAIRQLVPDWNETLTAHAVETHVEVIHDQAQ